MKVVEKALDEGSWRSLKGRYKGSGARQKKMACRSRVLGCRDADWQGRQGKGRLFCTWRTKMSLPALQAVASQWNDLRICGRGWRQVGCDVLEGGDGVSGLID